MLGSKSYRSILATYREAFENTKTQSAVLDGEDSKPEKFISLLEERGHLLSNLSDVRLDRDGIPEKVVSELVGLIRDILRLDQENKSRLREMTDKLKEDSVSFQKSLKGLNAYKPYNKKQPRFFDRKK